MEVKPVEYLEVVFIETIGESRPSQAEDEEASRSAHVPGTVLPPRGYPLPYDHQRRERDHSRQDLSPSALRTTLSRQQSAVRTKHIFVALCQVHTRIYATESFS